MRIDDPSKRGAGAIRVDAPVERLRDGTDPGNSTAPIALGAIGAQDESRPPVRALAAGAAALAGVLALTLALTLVRRRAR
ncbi:hypothetical protein [Streptomyces sp. LaBMicrA B280]|uniref:hypothetical protein n=1 Tax=Streptomyces sp. LaBMicrA B280 TaxID=3391001 RepID=UPI003BA78711